MCALVYLGLPRQKSQDVALVLTVGTGHGGCYGLRHVARVGVMVSIVGLYIVHTALATDEGCL